MSASTASTEPVPDGFFVLRTPLLPFGDLVAWSEGLEAAGAVGDRPALTMALARDRAILRERLLAAIAQPALRDAVFLASPSLSAALDQWEREPHREPEPAVEAAVVAYLSRSAARATPFGLFAGSSVGTVGGDGPTCLRLQSRSDYERHSRLDMDYLWSLAEAMTADPALRQGLVFRPNSSLYRAAGRLHLTETRLAGTERSNHLVAVDDTSYLSAVLRRAADGARLADLVDLLDDEDTAREDAEAFVAELVASQLLVADIRPAVTGDEPVHGLIAQLRGHQSTAEVAERLDAARQELEGIDVEGLGVPAERYRSAADLLRPLAVEPTLSRLVQVDLVKPLNGGNLSAGVVDDLARGVRLLHQLSPPPGRDGLLRFRESFADRYDTREVPLVEALDEEVGVGFERSGSPLAEGAPLLAGLPFPATSEGGRDWTSRETVLLRVLARALTNGAREVTLADAELEALRSRERPALPDAFHVMARLVAEDQSAVARGAYRVLVDHVAGPSGATLLGRFCHADEQLHRWVRAHLRTEEAARPEAVFAEIVHLPEGRIGNILCRPVLRDYEIPYLGRSGAPTERQLEVTDLLVSLREDRVVLRSRRLQREVVPRLTTAHNWSSSLGVYRFLCALQGQDLASSLAWDWGGVEDAPFLPRVVHGRVVLSRARWNLRSPDLRVVQQAGRGAEQFSAFQAWRAERGLPRYVALAREDNELVVDLDNVLCLDALSRQIRGLSDASLVEVLPGPDELCVVGPEGRFVHELIVPFVHPAPTTEGGGHSPHRREPHPTQVVSRRFPPGSEWLYAKLYCGPGTADRVLGRLANPVVRSALSSGAAESWFFIRYNDPEPHLRIRFRGEPARLHSEVAPLLQTAAGSLMEEGLLWRMAFDTYDREVERYGGPEAMELSEQIFAADSEAVIAVLDSLAGGAGLDLRWRLTLFGMDLLLDDLGLSLEDKRRIARRAREGYTREFGVDGVFRGQVGKRYREERSRLEALFGMKGQPPSSLAPGMSILRERSLAIAPVTAELRRLDEAGRLTCAMTELADSLLHMHANRLLRSAHRAQELVLHDLLDRIYTSQAEYGRART
jgi:lantibiotic biosynthesis protein